MDVAILGGRAYRFPPDWQKETIVSVFGGADLDSTAGAGSGARLTAVAVCGSVKLRVPAGSRVSMSGVSLLGGRKVSVAPGDGPEIAVKAVSVFGSVKVSD